MNKSTLVQKLIQLDEQIEKTKRFHVALDDHITKLEAQFRDCRLTASEKSKLQDELSEFKTKQDESVTLLFQLTQVRNQMDYTLTHIDDESHKAEQDADRKPDNVVI